MNNFLIILDDLNPLNATSVSYEVKKYEKYSNSGKSKTTTIKVNFSVSLFEEETNFSHIISTDEEVILVPGKRGETPITNLNNFELSEEIKKEMKKSIKTFIHSKEKEVTVINILLEKIEIFKNTYPKFFQILENNIQYLQNNGDYTTYTVVQLIYFLMGKNFAFEVNWSSEYNRKPIIERPYYVAKKSKDNSETNDLLKFFEEPEEYSTYFFIKDDKILSKINIPNRIIQNLHETHAYDLEIQDFIEFQFEIL